MEVNYKWDDLNGKGNDRKVYSITQMNTAVSERYSLTNMNGVSENKMVSYSLNNMNGLSADAIFIQ